MHSTERDQVFLSTCFLENIQNIWTACDLFYLHSCRCWSRGEEKRRKRNQRKTVYKIRIKKNKNKLTAYFIFKNHLEYFSQYFAQA